MRERDKGRGGLWGRNQDSGFSCLGRPRRDWVGGCTEGEGRRGESILRPVAKQHIFKMGSAKLLTLEQVDTANIHLIDGVIK